MSVWYEQRTAGQLTMTELQLETNRMVSDTYPEGERWAFLFWLKPDYVGHHVWVEIPETGDPWLSRGR